MQQRLKQPTNNVKYRNLARYIRVLSIWCALALSVILTACNAKDDETLSDSYTTDSVAISKFSLTADLRVMANLDSVFFSIDLEHGVVFNADSLPKGTNITKLVPKITYPSSVTFAEIEMTGGTHREGTVNYYKNASDTIDFTGDVTLTLGADNQAIKKTYRLKVNVHKEDPDTIYWDNTASLPLPSRLPEPVAQKSVADGNNVYCLIEEADRTFTLSRSSDIFAGSWSKHLIDPGFTPDVESFTLSPEGTFFVIAGGNLMSSADGTSWSLAASGWSSIIGNYHGILLGTSGGVMISWPEGAMTDIALPEGFPVSGYSAPIEFANRWSDNSTLVLFGGAKADGSLSAASWAFDGKSWADIANQPLPALEGIAVVDYYTYLNSTSNGLIKEFEVYLAFGGRDALGNASETVYITYDQGINWRPAPAYMQMPEGMDAGYMVSALAIGTSMESNLSDRWKARRKLPFEIDGDIVRWDCPYIFLFGGFDTNMKLNREIRSGVLQRLTFVPLF